MLFKAKFKTTVAIEKERLQLWNDYNTYKKVELSDELRSYLALKERVESIPFLEKKKEIEMLRFKGSPEETMLKEFQKLQKNKKLNRYFETIPSADLERFNVISKSGKLENLIELETFVKGGQFKANRLAFKKQKKADKENKDVWEKTEAYLKKKKYDDLKSSPDVLFHKRFSKSKNYKNFLAIDDSALLHQFEDLKAEIESTKFKDRKAYLEDVKRYEKTEDFKLLLQFDALDSKNDIQLYLKYNDTDAFKFFREWTPTFEVVFIKIDLEIW
nr:hypothetical protein [Prolixibacteraceae bacterium]